MKYNDNRIKDHFKLFITCTSISFLAIICVVWEIMCASRSFEVMVISFFKHVATSVNYIKQSEHVGSLSCDRSK